MIRKKDTIILVRDVAEILQVSTATIRAWANKGKLKFKRHPLNNYRMFSKNAMLKLRKEIGD